MKKSPIIMCVFLFGMAAIFSACSNDKKTNPVLTPGDPNDPTLAGARGQADVFVEIMMGQFSEGYDYLDWHGEAPLDAATDTFSANYNPASGWWSIYSHADDSTGAYLTFTDSIRFAGDGGYQQWPDSLNTEGIEYRVNFNNNLVFDTSLWQWQYVENIHLTGIQADQVAINGTSSIDFVVDNPHSDAAVNYDATLASIAFNHDDLEYESNPHPVSGALTWTMHVNSATPQGSGDITWHVAMTFYPDHYHVRFESGTNYWEWDAQYGG